MNDKFIEDEFSSPVSSKKSNYRTSDDEKKLSGFSGFSSSKLEGKRIGNDTDDEEEKSCTLNYTNTMQGRTFGSGKDTPDYRSPMKGDPIDDIPVTYINRDTAAFEVNNVHEEDGDDDEDDYEQDENSEDEAYDDNEEEENNDYEENEEEETKDDEKAGTDEDEGDEEETQADSVDEKSRREAEKGNIQKKLEEAVKKKETYEHLVKERSNHFIAKWGFKAFNELSNFFRTKVGVRYNTKAIMR